MLSKEEIEHRLLDYYYRLGLEKISGEKPKSVVIAEFVQSEKQGEFDYGWEFKDDQFLVSIWAPDLESGFRYFLARMAQEKVAKNPEDWFPRRRTAIEWILAYSPFAVFLTLPSVAMFFSSLVAELAGVVAILVYTGILMAVRSWRSGAELRLRKMLEGLGLYSAQELQEYPKFIGEELHMVKFSYATSLLIVGACILLLLIGILPWTGISW